ncbi:hypothetical protein [Pseudomonas fulva]|uniref:hypothetical protein n=1 Tax=Pseudomonas fulva TaxID=47880 RepID=UPI000D83650D|nr:hypothetical protein [Pseudomonas fulva]PYB87166.1 hypothetical protein DMX01_17830 [Pseudomonas fulva]PYC10967.1 hypothetical protein DMX00_18600 [Pseudomonas fulva]
MQSADYVPGVSGWKIHDDIRLELNDGNRRIHADVRMITTAAPGKTNDQAAQAIRDSIAGQAGRVTACEGTVTAQGTAVTRLTSRVSDQASTQAPHDPDGYITGEKLARQAAENARCRADSDMALAQRIGSVQCGLAAAADARATCTLTSRKFSEGAAEVRIKPEEAIEPLRMGRVLFEGEPARQIRAAQELLRKAGMGQLEVVQRASELGSPFVVIDGQVFIPDAMVKSPAIDPCTYSLKVTMGDDGRFYIAGVGIGVSTVASELNLGPSLEKDVRRLLREELKPGGMLHRGICSPAS